MKTKILLKQLKKLIRKKYFKTTLIKLKLIKKLFKQKPKEMRRHLKSREMLPSRLQMHWQKLGTNLHRMSLKRHSRGLHS